MDALVLHVVLGGQRVELTRDDASEPSAVVAAESESTVYRSADPEATTIGQRAKRSRVDHRRCRDRWFDWGGRITAARRQRGGNPERQDLLNHRGHGGHGENQETFFIL